MSAFAERLKLLRSTRKMTQARLAELIEVDPRVYNRWERGIATPQFDTVIKIADTLKISLDELAGRKDISSEITLHNPELQTLYQKVDVLDDEEQKALIMVIDSFVKRNQAEKMFSSK